MAMVRVHIWLRRKEGMSPEDFADYWLKRHAPIARDGHPGLKGYTVDLVTKVPGGGEAPYDGIAVLTWDTREEFSADMKSDVAARATEDMQSFTSASGLLFVEEHVVK
jgi:uncharacterized protein (TIGR02118 family)